MDVLTGLVQRALWLVVHCLLRMISIDIKLSRRHCIILIPRVHHLYKTRVADVIHGSPGATTVIWYIGRIGFGPRTLESTPFKPAWIRSPGRMQNSFANSSFFDEVAAHAKTDPLEARLRYLQDERGKALLERLATLSAWRTWTKSSHGAKHTGHGLAYTKYELVRTYVGVVCEVEFDRDRGEIAAKRFFLSCMTAVKSLIPTGYAIKSKVMWCRW
jgi:hypothetical protein